jgi:hypothetical protein
LEGGEANRAPAISTANNANIPIPRFMEVLV